MTGVIDERTIASPVQIAQRAIELIQDGTLGAATLISLQRVALGFLIGAIIGLVAGHRRRSHPDRRGRHRPADADAAHAAALRPDPAVHPLDGHRREPKIALIAMGVCFPLYLNTFAGIRGIDRKMLEAAQVDAPDLAASGSGTW